MEQATVLNELWQVRQLERLSKFQPDRVFQLFETLFQLDPDLKIELVIGAVDQEVLSIPEAARLTGLEHYEIERRLFEFRGQVTFQEVTVQREGPLGVARIGERGIPVWEIVREHRKLQSLEEVRSSFPELSKIEVSYALRYADENALEIQSQIDQYEAVVSRRKAEYPFSN